MEITVKNGEITAVDVPLYPDDNGKDRQINGYALPVLVQETLDAQSASIDMVSGATVTSTGYTQSLQSALDQAGL
ncbi:FMN-binding protein [Isoptericola sediminis]|uniref:FMN-binding protein n=1 Tax=Isoptericola sediminis TaxID=2733572 RepID=UPI0031B5F7FD